jgi:hypothetical protein
MNKISLLTIIIISIPFISMQQVTSTVFTPKIDREFDTLLGKYPRAVVQIIKYTKGVDYPDQKLVEKNLEDLSRDKKYQIAGIAFIRIDLADMPEIVSEYPEANRSVIKLFENGGAVQNPDGQDIELVGFADKATLRRFIDEYFGQALAQANAEYTKTGRVVEPGTPEKDRPRPKVGLTQEEFEKGYGGYCPNALGCGHIYNYNYPWGPWGYYSYYSAITNGRFRYGVPCVGPRDKIFPCDDGFAGSKHGGASRR